MATRDLELRLNALQEQIFQREGFRVSFVPFGFSEHALPPYDYAVMAPNGWRVSDWRRVRLSQYVQSFRDVVVYRGDGERVGKDVKLGHLRDTYYAAQHGTLLPQADTATATARSPAPSLTGVHSGGGGRSHRSRRPSTSSG